MDTRILKRQIPVLPGQLNPNANGLPTPEGVGPAPFKPGQPQMANPQRRVVQPGSFVMPADGIPVDRICDPTTIAAGGTATLISVRIPDGFTFRVAGIGFDAFDATALAFVSWSIFSDPPNVAIDPYINKPAGIGSVKHPSEVRLILGNSQTVTLVLSNTATVVSSYTYNARLVGWFYKELEART